MKTEQIDQNMYDQERENFDDYETISYLAGMKILLGEEVITWKEGPVKSLAIEGNEEDWDSLVLQITRLGETGPIRFTADEADHDEVYRLMCMVFACKNAGRYADLGEFLGYEVS